MQTSCEICTGVNAPATAFTSASFGSASAGPRLPAVTTVSTSSTGPQARHQRPAAMILRRNGQLFLTFRFDTDWRSMHAREDNAGEPTTDHESVTMHTDT